MPLHPQPITNDPRSSITLYQPGTRMYISWTALSWMQYINLQGDKAGGPKA